MPRGAPGQLVSLRLPAAVAATLEARCVELGVDRTSFIVDAVCAALDAGEPVVTIDHNETGGAADSGTITVRHRVFGPPPVTRDVPSSLDARGHVQPIPRSQTGRDKKRGR